MSISSNISFNSQSNALTAVGAPSIIQFPKEILELICRHLNSGKDVIQFALTNRTFYFLASDSPLSAPLWNLFLCKNFPNSCINLKSETKSLALYKRLTNVVHNMKAGKYRLQTLNGHQDWIYCMTISDGKLISGSGDNTIKIWDLKTGQELQTLNGHQGAIYCMTISDGKLISGSGDNTIKIWDLKTGQELQTLNGHQGAIYCMTISDSKLISGSGDTIKIWDLKTGQELHTLNGHQGAIYCMTISDGKLISGSYDNTIKIWDLKTGQELQTLNGHQGAIYCMTISDGKLISGSGDNTIKIWDLKTGKELHTLNGHQRMISCVTISDGKLISGSYDNTIKIWDLKTRQELQTLNGHQRMISCVTISDSKLISSSWDNTIKIWDFNFLSLSSHSKEVLEENLEILGKMDSEYEQPKVFEELFEKLHPDFKQRLQQHSLKIWISNLEILPSSKILASFPCCEAILQIQTEVCLEALLDAIHDEDFDRVDMLYKQLFENPAFRQLIENDPESITIYNNLLGKLTPNAGRLASILQQEQLVVGFKQILKKKWGEGLPLLLVDLGIVTKEEYSQKLKCTPDHLPKIGICSPADLQALWNFNSPNFQYLQITAEEVTQDRAQLQTRAFNKQRIVSTLLDELLAAANKKSDEAKQCSMVCDDSGIVYDVPNHWIAFQEKLRGIKGALSTYGLTRNELLEKFSQESYAELVKEVNALIDEFRTLEHKTQFVRLYAYVNQWGILGVWNRLRSQGIHSLSALFQQNSIIKPQDVFNMGE